MFRLVPQTVSGLMADKNNAGQMAAVVNVVSASLASNALKVFVEQSVSLRVLARNVATMAAVACAGYAAKTFGALKVSA